jgi:hypothetical protein
LVTGLLLVLLALSLAWWTWRAVPLGSAPAVSDKAAFPTVSPLGQGWFGGSEQPENRQSSRYVLRWTYAGQPGVCILGLPGLNDQVFKVGGEIEPGFVLREVGRDYVLVDGASGVERIERVRDEQVAVKHMEGNHVEGERGHREDRD